MDIKPGKDYNFQLSGNAEAQSVDFRINRKIPLIIKLAPIAIVGAIVPFLIGGDDGGGGGNGGSEDLPNPPDPPGENFNRYQKHQIIPNEAY
jgi:hypothetical protein